MGPRRGGADAPRSIAGVAVAMRHLLALLTCACAAAEETLQSNALLFDGDDKTGLVAENYGTRQISTKLTQGYSQVNITGNNRAYLVNDWVWATRWRDVSYKHLMLMERSLEFTIDFSKVGCGCNAAIYLVGMPAAPWGPGASDYCDIQDDDKRCAEIDILEGNRQALQSTLHMTAGHGQDGRCNQDGCYTNWGKLPSTRSRYGPGKEADIDSTKPFRVRVSFPEAVLDDTSDWRGASMDVRMWQGSGPEQVFFKNTENGNPKPGSESRGVSGADQFETKEALERGMVLVLALWSGQGKDDLAWMDGGCTAANF
eukprot:7381407-Prymnesium_polylepis.3